MGKDKKHKKEKHKKHSKEKSRKRDRSSSSESGSDSEEERRRVKAEKKARKVEEYWNKQSKQGGQTKFVWGKKIQRDLMMGKDVREFTAAALDRKHEERMSEVAKVQKRREEREEEKQRAEEELALLQRQRLAAEAVEQEQKEEEFHLQQAQVRAARRLAQGRAKPIDWLVADLYGVDANEDASRINDDANNSEDEREELRRQIEGEQYTEAIRRGGGRSYAERQREMEQQRAGTSVYYGQGTGGGFGRPRGLAAEPYQVMAGLLPEDLQELHDEVKGYQELESHVTPLNAEYWGCLLTLAEHELEAQSIREGADKRGIVLDVPSHAVRPVGAPLPQPVERSSSIAGLASVGGGSGVHSSVQRDIEMLLSGQSYGQLQAMEGDINRQLAAGQGDPEYWEAVLPRLRIHAAKARLREIKAQMLEERLAAQEEKLDVAAAMGWLDEQEAEADAIRQRRMAGGASASLPHGEARVVQDGDAPPSEEDNDQDADEAQAGQQQQRRAAHPDEDLEAQMEEEQEADDDDTFGGRRRGDASLAASDGRFSPPPVDPAELAAGELDVVGEEEDLRMLELQRQQTRLREAERFMSAAEIAARHSAATAGERALHNQLLDPRNALRGTHPMFKNIAAASNLETGVGRLGIGRQEENLDDQTRALRDQALKAMGLDEGDRNFGCEVPLESQAYWWHNRYAPRKPKYFNRVHTGYEWNKYNQTHYDYENPPPKVVQGYKFNIFYPDLLDRTKPPSYRVEPDPSGTKETCILVFSAGAPYEDIAFRIINKEWEMTYRRGFKCRFDRGILQLYFNFRRARYRR